ncbi:MAG: prephenate dehydrogenase/arogenate dehydrogenase family protein [Nitrospirae bacterium]|nr:prephenate dehydrogenase/arogenate dehydrogenase family protein [Nitrospirota bacterium]
MIPLPHFRRMVIIGVGLIGGSLALACREKGIVSEVIGVGRSEQNLKDAVALKAIDSYTFRVEDAVKGADIVILATPVRSLIRLSREIAPHLSPGAIVTDAGSVKGPLTEIENILPLGTHFVAGHPIAGKEKSGVKAAFPQLFQDAKCILTPTAKTDPDAVNTVQAMWEAAGARVQRMDPWQHDRIFAAVSHLPHVVAFALVNTLLDLEKESAGIISYSAGGFRDFTRIAASHPEMWRDICLMNRENVLEMLDRYEKSIARLKSMIRNDDADGLHSEFERARQVREKL